MPELAEVLALDDLDLDPSLVEELHVREFHDWTDAPSVRVTVVLRPEVDTETLEWPRLAPIDRKIVERVYEKLTDRVPYVNYLSHDDWQAELRGEDTEELAEEEAGGGSA